MTIRFYPFEEDLESSNLKEKLELLLEAAESYKAAILDQGLSMEDSADAYKRSIPREITISYNWEAIARVLSEIREAPESSAASRMLKAGQLTKLAEIYEVLRGARMPKLEAVRLALINEANQLRTSSAA